MVLAGWARAQSNTEIDDVRKRVAELEQQNRQILQALAELKASLKPVAAAPAAAPAREPAAAPPPPATAGPAVTWPEIVGAGNRLKFYGWLRIDTDIDSHRPNNGETPLFITPADPRTGSDKGLFSLHPRLTRLGIDFNGPAIQSFNGARLSGKFESDFENGGSESRQIIRIRHAYMQLKWGSAFTLLGGQTWDVFSPLYPTVNNDTLMWNAGNLGDRRPQVRADWQRKSGKGTWSLTAAAGLTGAIDGLDLDNNGYLDGQESGRPDVQARAGYSYPVLDQQLSLGASMFYGWANTARPIAGRSVFRSQATNIDFTLPLPHRLSLRGEGWWGRNMSDVRGGAGQGINVANGREIRGRGGWAEMSWKLRRFWSVHPGFTTDDPVDADIGAGGRTRNGSFYLGNRFTPSPAFTIGADYLRWKTTYKGALPGIDNRINLFFYYAF
jgi:hypothetical protein